MSSLDSRQNINEQENHDGGKGKGMRAKGHEDKRAKGQKGKRAKGQKPQTVISPLHKHLRHCTDIFFESHKVVFNGEENLC